MKRTSEGPLCTPDDVYALAGVTDNDVRNRERERIEQLIRMEPIFLWGENFEGRIRRKRWQARARVAHSVALKSGLISNQLHAQCIREALDTSDFCAGTYREIVTKWLNNLWTQTVAGVSFGYFMASKGEFEHYDEVKEYLSKIYELGGSVRILKGRDERTSLVVADLEARGIPVRVRSVDNPRIRLYICEGQYLYFVSLPSGMLLGFKGSNRGTLEAVKQLFEREWNNAGDSTNV